MKVKEDSERADLRLNIKKKLRSRQLDPLLHANRWGNVEVVTDFLFLDSKITADVDYYHEIRRKLLLFRKEMTTLDNVLKSRDITLPTKVRIVKTMIFPVVV